MEIPNQQSQATNSSNVVVLASVRDIKIYHELDPDANIQAGLQGIITRVTDRGGIVFFSIFDGTESIQLIANRKEFSASDWQALRMIKRSNRVTLLAYVVTSNRGILSLYLRTLPVQSPELRLDFWPDGESDPGHIGVQIYLARVRARTADFFIKHDFLELESNLLSASWEEHGLKPLRVEYPGFGPPVYLVPSPSPQLLRALVITGKSSVFTVSRCFTTTYRVAEASYESLMLYAMEIDASLERMYSLATDALQEVLSNFSTRPSELIFSSKWPLKEVNWPPYSADLNVSNPEIQIFKGFALTDSTLQKQEIHVFRICYPPNIVLAEGSFKLLDGGIGLGSLAIHVERIVLLIRTDTTIRRLRHQGATNILAMK